MQPAGTRAAIAVAVVSVAAARGEGVQGMEDEVLHGVVARVKPILDQEVHVQGGCLRLASLLTLAL